MRCAIISSGGTAPYTYTLQSGALPVGLSLSSAGVLSGTPTERGSYSFTDNFSGALHASDAEELYKKYYANLNYNLPFAEEKGTAHCHYQKVTVALRYNINSIKVAFILCFGYISWQFFALLSIGLSDTCRTTDTKSTVSETASCIKWSI
mgnify:CR=1 FL=1